MFICKELNHKLIVVCILQSSYNLIFLCTPELEEVLDEKEARIGGIMENEKTLGQNDVNMLDSREQEKHITNVGRAELREYNCFRSRTLQAYESTQV